MGKAHSIHTHYSRLFYSYRSLDSRFGEEDYNGYNTGAYNSGAYRPSAGSGVVSHTSGVIQNGQVYSNTYQQKIRK